jgi:hypothetical protein
MALSRVDLYYRNFVLYRRRDMEKIFLIILMAMNLNCFAYDQQMEFKLSEVEQEKILSDTLVIFGHLQNKYCYHSEAYLAHRILCDCMCKMIANYVPDGEKEGVIEETKNYLLNETIYSVNINSPIAYCLEAHDPEPEREEFWPADMIPHPNPPWHRPKKPSDNID